MKYLSPDKINAIHVEIDTKMQELEDSGLTREEVLFNEQVMIYINIKLCVKLDRNTLSR